MTRTQMQRQQMSRRSEIWNSISKNVETKDEDRPSGSQRVGERHRNRDTTNPVS